MPARSSRHRIRLIIIALLIVSAALLIYREYSRWPDGRLHLRFLDVGKGNATLITTPQGKYVLINGGSDWMALEQLGEHLPFFNRTMDLLILTSASADHLGSLPEVMKRYRVLAVLFPEMPSTQAHYQAFMEHLRPSQAVIINPASKTIAVESGVTLDIVWPLAEKGVPAGLGVALSYHGHQALLTGNTNETLAATGLRRQATTGATIEVIWE